MSAEVTQGEVLRHVYQKDTFRIMVCKTTKGQVSVLGHFGEFVLGSRVEIEGEHASHPTRGPQIKAKRVTEIRPTTEEGIVNYLSGGSFPGIGKTYAKRIVEAFGEQTEHVLTHEQDRLSTLKGIPKKALDALASEWVARSAQHEIMSYLRRTGLGEALSLRVYEKFRETTIERIKRNPYDLQSITGIGFSTADQMALAVGVPEDSPHRIQAAILHVFDESLETGDTCMTGADLYRKVNRLLADIENLQALFMPNLRSLVERRAIVEEKGLGPLCFYKYLTHHQECELAEDLIRLSKCKPSFAVDNVDRKLAAFEHERSMVLSDMQKEAVRSVCSNSVTVLTGGPGTGKTTVLSAVLHATSGSSVLMCAPTGKAANVMSTATGFAASTIHRLLEWSAQEEGFKRSRRQPLEANLIVVDEASMLELWLAGTLVQAVEEGARLLIVGDVDQLPSVGPGAVLRDLIASSIFPVVRLDRIYRQGAGSGIAHNAKRILGGKMPSPADDFFIIKGCDEEKARDMVLRLVSDTLPSKFGLDPRADIQVLVPRHKGPAGRVELNLALQEALNPATSAMDYVVGEDRYRVGDRVMQLRNAPEVSVFNGETGIITRIEGDEIAVMYPGERLVGYNKKNIEQLTLAYASTIHKSQGGEFAAVVAVVTSSAGWMLNRNLVYTAITRARKLVVLVTDDDARGVEIAVGKSGSERVTRLKERLIAMKKGSVA